MTLLPAKIDLTGMPGWFVYIYAIVWAGLFAWLMICAGQTFWALS